MVNALKQERYFVRSKGLSHTKPENIKLTFTEIKQADEKYPKDKLKDYCTEELFKYHGLDGKRTMQYPPMIKEGDVEGLKQFIKKFISYIIEQPAIQYIAAPKEFLKREVFRSKIARKAIPEIKGNVKKEFFAILEKIQNPIIKTFVKKAIDNAQPEFFTAPSSSTGQYHPADEINEGGLLLHTIRDVIMGEMLTKYFKISDTKKDEILASLILHDIQKGGIPWKHIDKFVNGAPSGSDPAHGKIAADWLVQFEEKNNLAYKQVEKMVERHMGRSNSPCPTSPKNIEEQIVSYADYLASRDNIYMKWH